MKNIPINCLAFSSFGFSIAHLCFAFFFAASDINFHISGYTSSRREVVCFLESLLPDHVHPSGGLPFSRTNHVNPVHASNNSLFPSTFQWSSIFVSTKNVQWCTCCSGNVDVPHWNRKCFFFRHVQFDSWFNVVTINQFSCYSPEGTCSFFIIPRWVFLKWGWRM